MINTKQLRKQYRLERATMNRNERIGTIVLTVLTVVWGAVLITPIVRLSCTLIVALHNGIK